MPLDLAAAIWESEALAVAAGFELALGAGAIEFDAAGALAGAAAGAGAAEGAAAEVPALAVSDFLFFRADLAGAAAVSAPADSAVVSADFLLFLLLFFVPVSLAAAFSEPALPASVDFLLSFLLVFEPVSPAAAVSEPAPAAWVVSAFFVFFVLFFAPVSLAAVSELALVAALESVVLLFLDFFVFGVAVPEEAAD
jgi:hypothetical protein